MQSEIPPSIYIIFTAVTAVGVLIQAGVLLGMFIGLRKLQTRVENILNHMSEYALPLVASSKTTLEELSPKLKVITNNLADVSEMLKEESKTIKSSVDDVLGRTRAQTARVDEMVSGTLDGISHASAVLQHGIEVPLRQLNGILNGVKVGFDVFRKKEKAAGERYDPVEQPVAIVIEEESVARAAEADLAGRPIH